MLTTSIVNEREWCTELSTCSFQFSPKTRQTMPLYAYLTPKVKFNHYQSFLYEWRLTARTIRKFRIGPSLRIESRIGRKIRNRIESRSFAGPYFKPASFSRCILSTAFRQNVPSAVSYSIIKCVFESLFESSLTNSRLRHLYILQHHDVIVSQAASTISVESQIGELHLADLSEMRQDKS